MGSGSSPGEDKVCGFAILYSLQTISPRKIAIFPNILNETGHSRSKEIERERETERSRDRSREREGGRVCVRERERAERKGFFYSDGVFFFNIFGPKIGRSPIQ